MPVRVAGAAATATATRRRAQPAEVRRLPGGARADQLLEIRAAAGATIGVDGHSRKMSRGTEEQKSSSGAEEQVKPAPRATTFGGMATPTLTKHELPAALGNILVDVRAGGRGSPRPAVVVMHGFKGFKDWGMFPPLAERLAQAGFSAVSFNASGSGVDESGEFVWPERFG